jgi:hypothetical protein
LRRIGRLTTISLNHFRSHDREFNILEAKNILLSMLRSRYSETAFLQLARPTGMIGLSDRSVDFAPILYLHDGKIFNPRISKLFGVPAAQHTQKRLFAVKGNQQG